MFILPSIVPVLNGRKIDSKAIESKKEVKASKEFNVVYVPFIVVLITLSLMFV